MNGHSLRCYRNAIQMPSAGASDKLTKAQKQLQMLQWTIPALTGVLVVLGAQQDEQQRSLKGPLDT